MLRKKIKFVNYNGEEREKEYLFNLTQAEVIKWVATEGDYTLDQILKKLTEEDNTKELISIFENLICMSYGEKSLDGDTFDKSDEVKKRFLYSEAYSVLFTELVSDAKRAADFINAILPSDLKDSVEKMIAENPDAISGLLTNNSSPTIIGA